MQNPGLGLASSEAAPGSKASQCSRLAAGSLWEVSDRGVAQISSTARAIRRFPYAGPLQVVPPCIARREIDTRAAGKRRTCDFRVEINPDF